MENVNPVKELLREKYFTVKLDLQVVYSRKKSFLSLCLCFRLGAAQRIFIKYPKIPISLMRGVQIRYVIYLEDLLIISGGQWKKCFWGRRQLSSYFKSEFCNEQRKILHGTKKSNGIIGIHHENQRPRQSFSYERKKRMRVLDLNLYKVSGGWEEI